MRLIIYLLAMLTGFSAANAVQPVSATPSALRSAVAQAAIISVTVKQAQHQNARNISAETPVADRSDAASAFNIAFDSAILPAPVERSDRLRE